MRRVVRAILQARSAYQIGGKDVSFSGFGRVGRMNLVRSHQVSAYRSLNIDGCEHSLVISRALFALAAKDSSGGLSASISDIARGGPFVEYERRISAGELMDGDSCQVGTLKELQRLYDELVQSSDACQLDRYSSSEKGSRSRWFWSRFIPQSSYSPVKGLYLYGGVGTGKTMLMDLFFDQLSHLLHAT